MTEHDVMRSALYADALAQPGSDEPRDRLAESIEGRWPERARLIRLQIETARMAKGLLTKTVPDSPAWMSARDLLKQLRKQLEEPVRFLGWITDWSFLRGLIGFVEIDARVFLNKAEELFSLFPVRHVALTNGAEVIVELAASPYLERLVGLSMRHQKLGDAEVLVLSESPYIRNLRWLDLMSNRIGLDGFEALVRSPNLPSLVHANLQFNSAPNPTAELGHDWTGAVVCLDRVPVTSEELERKYGYKPWLHGAELIPGYPPSYESFDGDDPVI